MMKIYKKKGTVHPSPPIISDRLSFLPATLLTLTAALSPEDREVLAYLISCSTTTNNYTFSFSSSPSASNITNNNKKQKPASNPGQRNSLYGNKSDYSMIKIDGNGKDHPTLFNCECFRCYMSYWVRWDSSPNRQLIHEIIDSFEDQLLLSQSTTSSKYETNNKKNKKSNKNKNNKKKGINNRSSHDDDDQLKSSDDQLSFFKDNVIAESSRAVYEEHSSSSSSQNSSDDGEEVVGDDYGDRGSLRKLVSSIGVRIWGVFA